MGLPEGVSVIAWGLSIERYSYFILLPFLRITILCYCFFIVFRPTMIKYGVDNIRDLVGPKVNLQMVADNPLLIEALTGSIVYESLGNRMAAQIDDWMDLTQTETLARDGRLVTDRMEKRLQQAQWLAGDGTGCKSLADVYLAAVLKDQLKSDRLKQWALRSS